MSQTRTCFPNRTILPVKMNSSEKKDAHHLTRTSRIKYTCYSSRVQTALSPTTIVRLIASRAWVPTRTTTWVRSRGLRRLRPMEASLAAMGCRSRAAATFSVRTPCQVKSSAAILFARRPSQTRRSIDQIRLLRTIL